MSYAVETSPPGPLSEATSPPGPLSEGEGECSPIPFGEGPGVGFAGAGFLRQRKNSTA